MFRLARKKGKLRDIPHFEMLQEPPPRKGFFEPAQYEALRAALPDYLRPVLVIAYHTAMRSGEVRSIRWDQVDFINGIIRLDANQTKTSSSRDIPIFGELKTVLLQRYANRRPDYEYVCFRVTKSGKVVPIRDFRKVWQDRCVKLGLGRWVQARDLVTGKPLFERPRGTRSKPKPKMIYEGLLVHDLRRSGVRNLNRAGVPDKIAMAISGHKTRSVYDRYNIVSERDLKEAGKKLESYLAENRSNFGADFKCRFADQRPTKLTIKQLGA
jgi:integrase